MSTLEDIVASLKRLGDAKAISTAVAKESAPLVVSAIQKSLAAGQSPDGKPWPLRKDGGRAYANAAAAVEGKSTGPLVYITLTGPEVFGHFGFKGRAPSPMLPDAGGSIPPTITKALETAVGIVFEKVTR